MKLEWNSSDNRFFGDLSRELYYADLLIEEVLAENLVDVKRLLQKASPSAVVPERGVAAMHLLAGLQNENFSTAVTLLALQEGGADPNVRSEEGLTPVHVAAMWGRCRVLEVLLAHGGDPSLRDYRTGLNAEEYAMQEHQWHAYGVLITFTVIAEDVDHCAKNLEADCTYESGTSISDSREAESSFDRSWTAEHTDDEDYDWVNKTKQVIPLNEKAIDLINRHRRKTQVYQYSEEGSCTTSLSSGAPKRTRERPLKCRTTPRIHEGNKGSEIYVCGFAESSYKLKSESTRGVMDSTGVASSDAGSGNIPSNRVLCKMSRILLFMLKKRHIHQRIK